MHQKYPRHRCSIWRRTRACGSRGPQAKRRQRVFRASCRHHGGPNPSRVGQGQGKSSRWQRHFRPPGVCGWRQSGAAGRRGLHMDGGTHRRGGGPRPRARWLVLLGGAFLLPAAIKQRSPPSRFHRFPRSAQPVSARSRCSGRTPVAGLPACRRVTQQVHGRRADEAGHKGAGRAGATSSGVPPVPSLPRSSRSCAAPGSWPRPGRG